MVHDFITLFTRIANMNDEEKKNRLVEIRKAQILTEALTGHDDIPKTHELEAMLILGALIPMNDEEDAKVTIAKVVALREEINQKATTK